MKNLKYVGQASTRRDSIDKATGRAVYASDMTMEGMLWGFVLRSPHPHARILKIDAGEALKVSGAAAVLTAGDVPGANEFGVITKDQPVLCKDKVRFIGDAVALVAAETKEIAEEASQKIKVNYEIFPAYFNPEESLKETAVLIHEKGNILKHIHVTKGDIKKGFQDSDFIIEEEFVTPFGDHAYLETECGLAEVDEEGNINVWASTQSPYRDQMEIAHAMGLPLEKVRVIAPYLGGGFGKKDGITVQIYLALLALKTGKPVKMQSSREESISCYYKRHATVFKHKLGLKKDGTLMALKSKIVYDTGAYASFGEKVLGGGIEYGTGPYKIKNIDMEGFSVYTNQAPAGAFRGFGMPQASFAMELLMDMAAEKLSMDPIEFRLKNAVKQGEEAALGHIMEYSTAAKETLEILKESELWKEKEKLKNDLDPEQKEWKRRGVGIACSFKGCGLAIGIPDFSNAKIEIKKDGKFILRVGNTEMGQGSQWTYTLIAAETLGCPTDDITTILPDTFTNLSGGSTSASRSTMLGGNATYRACRQLKEVMTEAAAGKLKALKEDIEFSKGKISVKNKPDKFLSLSDTASILYNEGKPVSAASKVDMPLASKQDIGYGLPHIIYGYASHLALVEVDTLTGEVEILKLVSAIDCGKPIYIHGVEGQSEGGAAMGVGYVLMENQLYEGGRILNPNYSTYIIPTALDMPEIETRIVDTYEEQGPFGAKGIGECVTGPTAPAVVNAVRDAIGIRFKRIPVLPEMIVEALSNKNRKG